MTRLILGLVAGVVGVSSAVAQPADKPPAKAVVEFRWLEHSPDKALTEDKGIQTTCGPELMYPHKKPALVLTPAEVAFLESSPQPSAPNPEPPTGGQP